MNLSKSILLIATLSLLACGGASNARHALEYAADVGVEADAKVAAYHNEAHAVAYAESTSRADYDARMRSANKAVDALIVYRSALKSAEDALDAHSEATGDASWQMAMTCVIQAAGQLRSTLYLAKIPIPKAFEDLMKTASMFGRDCEPQL